MPGKHDPAKRFVTFSMLRRKWYQIKQEADERGMDLSSYVFMLFDEATRNTQLTPENEEKCNAETEAERKRRAESYSGYDKRIAQLRKAGGLGRNQVTGKAKDNKTKKGKK